jgi:glycosyltransferase involved in cell wall biosynthesis
MRILLTSTASFVPPRGGSTRSNRAWLEVLASRGHQCRVVCGAAPAETREQIEAVTAEAASQGLLVHPERDHQEFVDASGIQLSIHRRLGRQAGLLAGEIESFRPDWVLVSSEDIGHSLLREADEAAPGRVVYLAHTPQFLPFGAESWSPDAQAAARVRRAAAVIVIGNHMAGYIGGAAAVIHPPVYGPGPFENIARWDEGFVLMVNPCAVKGIGIFRDVARALPHVKFAALPGWGTTPADRASLEALPNVHLLEPVRRIHEVLERTRVLLMPSLWYEGFGLIVMEAQLRGIPVIASDSGGLPEAKRSRDFVLPVNPIREYLAEFDEVHMPRPVVPQQDFEAWVSALGTLLTDRAAYERESERGFEAAVDFVYTLRASAMEELLLSLDQATPDSQPVRRLTASQKQLLLARLKTRVRP